MDAGEAAGMARWGRWMDGWEVPDGRTEGIAVDTVEL